MRFLFPLYACSGFVSLGYQVAWFRLFVDRFGSTNVTFAFVLVNFLGGLGAGSLASQPLVQRLTKWIRVDDALRLYGVVELLIAATALLTLLLPLIPADAWGPFPYERDGAVFQPTAVYRYSQLAISVACVFVPCFLMGVTFPLLCRAFVREASFPAALYAWNTLGACAGVLACEFALLPWLGHDHMFLALVLANVALGVYFVARRTVPVPVEPPAQAPAAPADTARGERKPRGAGRAPQSPAPTKAAGPATAELSPGAVLAAAIVSGALTGAFEADVLRRVQFLDCRTAASLSCISFWAILAIFLASWTVRAVPRLSLRQIRVGMAAALGLQLVLWHFGYPLRDWMNAADHARVIAALPPMPPGLSVEFAFWNFAYGLGPILGFTGLFVFPAFYLLSLLLPHVCTVAQARGQHLGVVYGANTLAFCLGVVGFTTLAPLGNAFYALRLFFGVFAVGTAFVLVLRPSGQRLLPSAAAAAAAAIALIALVPATFAPSYLPDDSPAAHLPVRALKSDGTNTTYVVSEPDGDLLFFDSYSMSGCNPVAQQYMRLMAHVPLLAQDAPKAALLICFGVGNTASAIAAHDTIERLDVVDLNDQVFATAKEFAKHNHDVIADPRVTLVHDDGRRFLALTDRRYDLITSEPPPPLVPGVSRLYSLEYYRRAAACLTPTGVMTQWLPIDQFPLPAMRAAIASFVQVFPHAVLFTGHGTNYILMGSNAPWQWHTLERRFGTAPRVAQDLLQFGIRRAVQVFARIVKCDATLQREFAALPGIRDAHNDLSFLFHDPTAPPVVTYDPAAMLAELDGAGPPLACHDELARTVMHLGRLRTMVSDLPEAALMSVRTTSRALVAMADIDWRTTLRWCEAGERAAAAGDRDRAIQCLQSAVALAPEYGAPILRLADLWSQAGNWPAALQASQRALAITPDDPTAGYFVAYSLLQTGQAGAALELATRLQRDHADLAFVHRVAGDVFAANGRAAEARAAYDRALALDPNDAYARAARDRVPPPR